MIDERNQPIHERTQRPRSKSKIRNAKPADFEGIIELCKQVYPFSLPYGKKQLQSHLDVFPEGQFVAVRLFPDGSEKIVGYAASLIIRWDDYEGHEDWQDFTDHGMFTNHDTNGRTLYGAEVMVDTHERGQGIGKRLYEAREKLVRRLKLLRIRAGARLRDYAKQAAKINAKTGEVLTPANYVDRVIAGEISDRTLSFQLRRGFHVLSIVKNYLPGDPESQGYAAIIELINADVAKHGDREDHRNSPFFDKKQ